MLTREKMDRFRDTGFYCPQENLWHGGHYPKKLWRFYRLTRSLKGTLSHWLRERRWHRSITDEEPELASPAP